MGTAAKSTGQTKRTEGNGRSSADAFDARTSQATIRLRIRYHIGSRDFAYLSHSEGAITVIAQSRSVPK